MANKTCRYCSGESCLACDPPVKGVINVQIYDPLELTVEEYEQVQRELVAVVACDNFGPTERILSRILYDNHQRYVHLKKHFHALDKGKEHS